MNEYDAKVLAENSLEQYLISKGINTKTAFHCLNPSHDDKHPSMSFLPRAQGFNKQVCHCFSCNCWMDIFDVVSVDTGLSKKDRNLYLKTYEILGIKLDEKKENIKKAAADQPQTDYSSFFDEAHSHIMETSYHRGLSREILDKYHIGYVKNWFHPKSKNVKPSERLIIPTSKNSYLARAIDEKNSAPKMKVGAANFFNIEALQLATEPIFVVEGELDALSVIQSEGTAIALGSVANIEKLGKLIKENPPKQPLIIALDNDEVGKKNGKTLFSLLSGLGIKVFEKNPYGGAKDANEVLLHNPNYLKEQIALIKEEVLSNTEDDIAAAREEYLRKSALYDIAHFKNSINSSIISTAIPTGYPKLDNALGGGLYSGLIVCGAMSSCGKTTLICSNIAENIAAQGKNVIIFSLEQSKNELIGKAISRKTMELSVEEGHGTAFAKSFRGIVEGSRYENYSVDEKAVIELSIAAYSEYASNIFIHEGVGDIGVEQIRKTVKEHIAYVGKKPVVIVDYLQILSPYNERSTDKQNIDKAVIELKRISRDFDIPVIVISSLNRASYNEKISMAAFKESGAIEYSADVLLGMYVDDDSSEYEKKLRTNVRSVNVKILKNRNGRVGDEIKYNYYCPFNYFQELDNSNDAVEWGYKEEEFIY